MRRAGSEPVLLEGADVLVELDDGMVAVKRLGRFAFVVKRLAEEHPVRLGEPLGDDRGHLIAQDMNGVGVQLAHEAFGPEVAQAFGVLQQQVDGEVVLPKRHGARQDEIDRPAVARC